MYVTEINGGLTTVTTVDDVWEAVNTIQMVIATAWQTVPVGGQWYDQMPSTIHVPVTDDFERRFWSQLAPDWMPTPEDTNAMVARVCWRLVKKDVEGITLGKVSFYFEDHPAFEIYSARA